MSTLPVTNRIIAAALIAAFVLPAVPVSAGTSADAVGSFKIAADLSRRSSQELAVKQAANVIAIVSATLDPDGDGFPEAPVYVTGAGPGGGGLVPTNLGAPTSDGYGGMLGYCVWDNGSVVTGGVNRLTGSATNLGAPSFAVVSAGPDGVFNRTCAQIAAGTVTTDDDFVVAVSTMQIKQGVGGTVYFGDPVADFSALTALNTATTKDGELRLVKMGNTLWRWSSTSATWISAANPVALSNISAATVANLINNAANAQRWNWQLSGAGTGFAIGETAASTGGSGSQYLTTIGTLASSSAIALSVAVRGVEAFRVDSVNPQIVANAGTVAAPSYAFAGSQGTGMYLPAANTIGLATNGAARLTIDASGNVGIGTTTPVNKLDVVGTVGANRVAITQSASNVAGMVVTGAAIDGGSTDNVNGVVFGLGVNTGVNNRQIWMGPTEAVGNVNNSVLRVVAGSNIASIDAVKGDGSARVPINLGTSSSDVAIGNSFGLAYNATLPGKLSIYAESAKKALVVIGTASQTGNLLELQNNLGTSLFTVTPAGNLTTSGTAVFNGNVSSNANMFIANSGSGTTQNGVLYFGAVGEGTDTISLARVNTTANNSVLQMTLGDDPSLSIGGGGDRFQIATNESGTPNVRHAFDSNGNAYHAGDLTVGGKVVQPGMSQYVMSRGLTSGVAAVDIGNFYAPGALNNNSQGGLMLRMTITSSDYYNVGARSYLIPIGNNATNGAWQVVGAQTRWNLWGGNDYELDINTSGANTSLRLRWTGGGNGSYKRIQMEVVGDNYTFTESAATSVPPTPTAYYGLTAITSNGSNVGMGTGAPQNRLDITNNTRSGSHATGRPLYITGDVNAYDTGVEIRHSNGTQGIGFGYNGIYAAGSNANQDIGLVANGTGGVYFRTNGAERMRLDASGNVTATSFTGTFISDDASSTNGSRPAKGVYVWTDKTFGMELQNQNTTWNTTFTTRAADGGFNFKKSDGTQLLYMANNGNSSFTGTVSMTGLSATTGAFSGAVTANSNVNINNSKLIFNDIVGDKIQLYTTYGLGIQNYTLAAYMPAGAQFSIKNGGTSTGTTVFNMDSSGNLSNLGNAAIGSNLTTGGDITPGGKIVVMNGQNGGTGRGIFLNTAIDTNWGIYMGTNGATKSLSGGTATYSLDGRTGSQLRFRASGFGNQQGFLWENDSEQVLMSLTSNTGVLYTKSDIVGGGHLGIANGKGIFFNTTLDSNWGIYRALAGGTNSLGAGAATASIDGRTGAQLRFRAGNGVGEGYTWENLAEQALMSLTSDTGNLYTKGNIVAGGTVTATSFTGSGAGLTNVVNSFNTRTGAVTLTLNDVNGVTSFGASNTTLGTLSLSTASTGSGLTAFGNGALNANTSGNYSTAIGTYALQNNTTGVGNSAVGISALRVNGTGSNNIAIGRDAGNQTSGGVATNANTTGSNNSFLGAFAMPGTATQLTYATALGSEALVSTSNTIVLGRATDNTVIGAAGDDASGNKLQVTGSIKSMLATSGTSLLLQTAAGGAGTYNEIASASYTFGANAPAARIRFVDDGSASSAITFRTKTSGVITNADAERMRIAPDGKLLIGSPTDDGSGNVVQVTGGIKSTGNLTVGGNLGLPNGKGIFFATIADPNWGIYRAAAGATNSLSGGTAASSLDNRTNFQLRFRAANFVDQGFLWENNSEQALMSLTADTGNLYTKGNVNVGGNLAVTGTGTFSSNLSVTGTGTFNGNVNINNSKLIYNDVLGDKLQLYGGFGFGIQGGTLAAFITNGSQFSIKSGGTSTGTTVFNVDSFGSATLGGNLYVAGTANINNNNKLVFNDAIGDRIQLFSGGFGFGIQSGTLAAFVPNGSQFSVKSGGSSTGTTVFNVDSFGSATLAGNLYVAGAANINGSVSLLSQGSGTYIGMTIGRTATEAAIGIAATAGNYSASSNPGDLVLRTEATSQRMILQNGAGAAGLAIYNNRLGIGTVSPSQALDVVGNANISGAVTAPLFTGTFIADDSTSTNGARPAKGVYVWTDKTFGMELQNQAGVWNTTFMTRAADGGFNFKKSDGTQFLTIANNGNSTFSGTVTAASFSGNGFGMTNLNGSNINSGMVGVTYGGTGVNGSAAASGQLLIGNGSGYTLAGLTAGAGVSITPGAGSITIANTGVTSFNARTGTVTFSKGDVDGVVSSGANTSIGNSSMPINSGFYNTAVGTWAMKSVTTGDSNSSLGAGSQEFATGSSNASFGREALRRASGSQNVAFGGLTLQNVLGGASNTGFGNSAGQGITIGNNNLFLGASADASVNNLTYASALGSNALVSTSNTIVLGRATDNTVIGAASDDASGNKLQVTGGIKATGSVTAASYVTTSDQRLKENIVAVDRSDVLERLKKLHGYQYNLISNPEKTQTYGVLAQEILTLFPNTVRTGSNGFYAVDYGALSALTATAVGQLAINMEKYGIAPNGGTAPEGALMIGNGKGFTLGTLTADSGISITNTAGRITIKNTGVTGFNGRTGNITLDLADINAVTGFGNGNYTSGTGALAMTSSGSFNTAAGQGALASTGDGSGNSAQGYQALFGNTSGNNNVAIGRQAGYASRIGVTANANLRGSNNTFVGAYALPGTVQQLNYATAIGSDAIVTTSGTIVLGRSDDVTVLGAAGDDRSGNRLQVTGSIKATGRMTANSLQLTTGSRAGVWIDNGAAAGASNGLVQAGDSTMLFSKGVIDGPAGLVIGPWTGASNGLRISNSGVTVGGGLTVNGPVTSSAGYAMVSDARFKRNIDPIKDAIALISKLEGVRYEFDRTRFPERNFEGGKQLGLIAQQVEPILPELVRTDAEGFKSLQYSQLAPLLIEGIKAQQAILKHLVKKDPTTLTVDIKTFQGNDAVFENIKSTNIKTANLEAETARIKKLEADRIESKFIRSDVVKTGEAEVFVSAGTFQPIFAPQADSQYIVNVTAEDGSSAFASVAFMSGKISVTPISGKGVDVTSMGAQVGLVAASKKVKATWIRMS